MILFLTDPKDLHAHKVAQHLERYQQTYHYFAYSDYPHSSAWSIQWDHDYQSTLRHFERAYDLNLNAIQSVWYRRPHTPVPHTDVKSDFRHYIQKESFAFLKSLEFLTPQALWVSKYYDITQAEHKPYQLVQAQKAGFNIPKTYMGNDPIIAEQFIEQFESVILKPLHYATPQFSLNLPQKVLLNIYKTLFNQHIEEEFQEYSQLQVDFHNHVGLFTRLYSAPDMKAQLDNIPYCPVILQEPIPKKLELRVTVVGDQVFPCALIHTDRMKEDARVDWRLDHENIDYQPFTFSNQQEKQCLELLKSLNLKFGCLDFILTPDDDLYFLENNPSGQWLWIEEAANLPISQAIADLLISR